MLEKNSKNQQLSIKDWKKILFLVISFLSGFYITNMDFINSYIGDFVDPTTAGIITLFLGYTAKLFIRDNVK